jgi:protein involved in polysaccharide export with SLBB domain
MLAHDRTGLKGDPKPMRQGTASSGWRVLATMCLAALIVSGCHTNGTVLVDPRGRDIDVSPEEVREMSGPAMPYLVQVGDQVELGFRVRDYRQGAADWDYRIEVGDSMEVRLSQALRGREDYRIDVGDLIGISFLNQWSLNVTRTVRPDGYVTFESVGDVRAAGMTAEHLEDKLNELYDETGLLEGDPNITVTVEFSNPDRLENMSRDLVVRPDGKIRLPVIPEDILVAGLTVDEASEAVRAAASRVLYNDPIVTLVVFPFINTALSAMNGVYTVRPDGAVSIPRIGEVQAAGYSTAELRRALAEEAGAVLHNPVTPSVRVAEATGARVYVGGEVGVPGVYPLEGAPTALQAVIMARGATNDGRLNSVLVIRRNPNGKPYVFKTNLNRAFRGSTENDLALRQFDVVYVPKKLVSRANLFVRQYIDDIVPFNNTLGVTGTYYLNEQRTRSKSRNFNYSTGVNVIPDVLP